MVQQNVNVSQCNESTKPPFFGMTETNFTIIWQNFDVAVGLRHKFIQAQDCLDDTNLKTGTI